ncbi:sodium-coupled monocarboxylate transporter 2-like isoform X1 [Metopolophium dirhodum]|uniref:sodium-coupled monocarboxylate transporter 2-like isoform X1 n=1 Tax=Metopolophium dirhodum TaxID=44670 RepID=UPI0029907405|nr:sodium-coupled monocarboxylate transporter 2-like isoform X1 [Metopolophium dirhodum]XP_060880513.1 sodium-coupled monocarboxylate transporter 2-like isoform X1 [Metopolophium dirhodum]XP_060880514.1 sodium-coupled monocarboxylate transporter 2-like isoform X1 [Metopolophium dirhodum]XP_060880515.1 sodium-coupled monocarboxylate transporter 2-like isoform X1 [Metopolophium dirhodum]
MQSIIFDYAVFLLLIALSFAVLIYSKITGPKEQTKANYVFASKGSVSMGAMLLSITRGFLGVKVFLGYPSEFYYRGSGMWETLYGMSLAFPLVLYFFLPVYFNLGITSVYQYLDMRFKSRLVRRLASATYFIRSIQNLGVTVFTPCVALKTVMGLPYWFSIILITSISIVFTVLGGLRSAILADAVQSLVMIGCSIVIIIHGFFIAKGPLNVFEVTKERDRLDFFNFNIDPTLRVSTVSATLGQLFMTLSMFGCQQNIVQRYFSMESQKQVEKALWLTIPLTIFLFSLSWIVGMVIFTVYADCDPRALGYISEIDEIIPFYIEDRFYFLPGFMGLVLASLFNSGLSIVSNLNSISTVAWEDFVSQIPIFKGASEKKQLWCIKSIGVITGFIVMGVAFIVAQSSGVIDASQLMTSATSGPLLGVFVLAMFFPSTNWKGAAAGMISSHLMTLFIVLGSLSIAKEPNYLPVSTEGCTNTTFSPHIEPIFDIQYNQYKMSFLNKTHDEISSVLSTPEVDSSSTDDILTMLYSITYMYYSLLGTFVLVFVGVIVSYMTAIRTRDDIQYHPLGYEPIL